MENVPQDMPVLSGNRSPVILRRGIVYPISIAAAVAVALALRWIGLGRESLWFDEGYTAWISSLPPGQIIQIVKGDISPPVYYILLHYWMKVFGNSEAAMRGMSALFGTLSIPLFYLLARDILRDRAAIAVAMWLLAISPMQIWFCQEARFYEMMSLLAAVSVYCLHRWLMGRKLWAFVGLVLSLAGALYAHNIMAFYILALDAAWLLWPSGSPLKFGRRILELAGANALAGLLYLPWVPSLMGQMRWIKGNFWASAPWGWDLVEVGEFAAGVKYRYTTMLLQRVMPGLSEDLAHKSVKSAVLLLILALLVWGFVGLRRRAWWRQILALTTYAVLPLLVVFAYSHLRQPMFMDRIFVASSAILPLLLAAPVACLGNRRQGLVCALLLGIFITASLLSVRGMWRHDHKEDWRGASSYILNLAPQPRLVVFVGNEGELLFSYYADRQGGIPAGLAKTGVPASFFDRQPPQTIQRVRADADLDPLRKQVASGRYGEIVLVLGHDYFSDPENRVRTYLDQALGVAEEMEFWQIKIRRYVDARR